MKMFFSRLRPRHWAWLHVMASAGLWWPISILLAPPKFLKGNVDPFILTLSMVIAVLGTILVVIGYVFSQQEGKQGVLGVSVELIGLALAPIGAIAYLISYSYLLFTGSDDVNFGSAFILAYTVCAVFLYRAVIVIPRFRQEAHDSAKE